MGFTVGIEILSNLLDDSEKRKIFAASLLSYLSFSFVGFRMNDIRVFAREWNISLRFVRSNANYTLYMGNCLIFIRILRYYSKVNTKYVLHVYNEVFQNLQRVRYCNVNKICKH